MEVKVVLYPILRENKKEHAASALKTLQIAE